jgi:hypothetical protein
MRAGSGVNGEVEGRGRGDVLSPRVLREYALVADGERGALIGPDGSVTWLCVPRWDSPAAFSGLLGGPGRYTITPAGPWHVWGGYYEPGSLIWRSRWVGDSRVECREALAMPADPDRAVLLRRVEAVDGPAKVTVVLDLRGGYGRGRMTDLSRQGDVWTGRSGRLRFRWSGAGRARHVDGRLRMAVKLAAGEKHAFVLELGDLDLRDKHPDPDTLWTATEEAWARVVPDCADLIAVADARHAYAVLRGLTSASGAMVAAATTSLPERLQGGRRRSPPTPSRSGGGNRTPASGNSATSAGRTPGSPAWPGCERSRRRPGAGRPAGTGTGRPRAGRHWPTRSPRASATACTLPGGCSGRRAIRGRTPPCWCR